MYIHLGNDIIVNTDSIVGVFDLEKSSLGKDTRELLARLQRSGGIINVTDEMPKSFILATNPTRAYICQVSSATILRRHKQN